MNDQAVLSNNHDEKEAEHTESNNESGSIDASEAFEVNNVIDTFLHRIMDIEDCAKEYITAASKGYNENAKKLRGSIEKHQKTLEDEKDETVRVLTVKELRKTLREIERHNNSSPVANN